MISAYSQSGESFFMGAHTRNEILKEAVSVGIHYIIKVVSGIIGNVR